MFISNSKLYSQTNFNTEICDNAIDDDGDGLIDLQDEDCVCELIEPISFINNPSFEDQICCPSARAQLSCTDGWIQASEPTTDYLNTCGWMGWSEYPPPLPFPDGEGIMGFRDGRVIDRSGGIDNADPNWKEYAGSCLINPLLSRNKYRFEFFLGFSNSEYSPDIEVTIFGTSDCRYLPFGVGDEELGCPTNGPNWEWLGSTFASGSGGNRWIKTSIDVTPRNDITAIAIGPACIASTSKQLTYYFFDNLVLADLRSFEFQIGAIEHPCSADFLLSVPDEERITYQWYKDGIALLDENTHQLSEMYGEGAYQVRTTSDQGCQLTQIYNHQIPTFESQESMIICQDETFQFGSQLIEASGIYTETFSDQNQCDSTVDLTLKELGQDADSVQVRVFNGESYKGIEGESFSTPGSHLVSLTSSFGCDSLVLLQLDYYNVYFPNVFSPTATGKNAFFSIAGTDDLQEIVNLTIFDKWGGEVYNANNQFEGESSGWDGRHNGQFVESGVYTYITILLMNDGLERQFVGSVLVLL